MKNEITSNAKIKLNKRQETANIYNKIKSNNVSKSNLNKNKSLNKIFINYRSCIPKQKLLKILVKHQNNNSSNDTNFINTLRNRVCNYQIKNEIIAKEIKELRNETKTFIKRYNMSGLLTPKNNSHFLKLGLSKEAIKDINSEGYKVSEVINKTNIFDKSLLLNRQYAKFARNILAENNPELINDNKYIGKMNKSLNEKKNGEYFKFNNNLNEVTNIKKRSTMNSEFLNKEEIDKKRKVSVFQLINEFNVIKKDIKMISNKKLTNEGKKRKIKGKDLFKKSLNDSKKLLIKLEGRRIDKDESKKELSFIKDTDKAKNIKTVRFKSFQINNFKSLSSENLPLKNIENDKNNVIDNRVFLPDLNINKDKDNISNVLKTPTNINSSNDSFFGSINFSSFLNKDRIEKEEKNKRSFTNLFKNKRKKEKRHSVFNRNRIIEYLSVDDLNNNPMNKTVGNKTKEVIEKEKLDIEEYKKNRKNDLYNLYNNIQIKHFEEYKKDISEYLKKYKGAIVKDPNYERGSKIYKMINEFILKTGDYNLPNEISKIRNKTNMFSYKRSKKFLDIIKMNNKIQNLIYDYAEDILDFNSDIRK